eukprot:1235098-Rhodomonas_salina.4
MSAESEHSPPPLFPPPFPPRPRHHQAPSQLCLSSEREQGLEALWPSALRARAITHAFAGVSRRACYPIRGTHMAHDGPGEAMAKVWIAP